MSPDLSESSVSDTSSKLQSSSYSSQMSDYGFSYSVMGAMVLFPEKPTLAQMQGLQAFFRNLNDELIEEIIDGLLKSQRS